MVTNHGFPIHHPFNAPLVGPPIVEKPQICQDQGGEAGRVGGGLVEAEGENAWVTTVSVLLRNPPDIQLRNLRVAPALRSTLYCIRNTVQLGLVGAESKIHQLPSHVIQQSESHCEDSLGEKMEILGELL